MSYKQRFLVSITLFTILGSSGLYLANSLKQSAEKRADSEVEGVQDFTSAPQIVNVAPIEATVGQEYRYDVEAVDQDTLATDLVLTLTDGPSWLLSSGLSMYGTPSDSDIGTYKVSYTLTDGDNTVTEEFYIVVESADEGSN